MRILLTGVAGFIGCHTAQKLVRDGHSVVGIDNFSDYYNPQLKRDRIKSVVPKSVKVVEGDILDMKLLNQLAQEHKFDAIIHLAAQAGVRYSLENPDAYIQTNIQGTNNMFELARHHDIPKVIFASSSSVYGGNKDMPFREDHPVEKPISLYAATKRTNELQAYTYNHLFGTQMIGLRFFTVYGPWGRPDMAAYLFSEAISKGKAIDVFNGGKMARGFTYVTDIVDGIVACLDYTPKEGVDIFNLSNEEAIELTRYISLIEKNLKKLSKQNMLPMQPGDVPKTWADISKAQQLLGYTPQTPIDVGIRNFIDWYREYHDN